MVMEIGVEIEFFGEGVVVVEWNGEFCGVVIECVVVMGFVLSEVDVD